MFTASENEDIQYTELFETSHLAGMQITNVNIFTEFRLSLSTKMLPKVMFSLNIAKGTTDPGVDCFDQ